MNQPKILVVDDDKVFVGAIKIRLEMEDYEFSVHETKTYEVIEND